MLDTNNNTADCESPWEIPDFWANPPVEIAWASGRPAQERPELVGFGSGALAASAPANDKSSPTAAPNVQDACFWSGKDVMACDPTGLPCESELNHRGEPAAVSSAGASASWMPEASSSASAWTSSSSSKAFDDPWSSVVGDAIPVLALRLEAVPHIQGPVVASRTIICCARSVRAVVIERIKL